MWSETTNEIQNAKKAEKRKKKKGFLSAVYSNPVVWNTNESNLNAYISWTVNVVLVCIPFQPLKCTFFCVLFSSTFDGLIMRVYYQKRWFRILFIPYSKHHTINYELYEKQQKKLSMIHMQCIRNGAIPWKCFFGVFRAQATCITEYIRV